MRTNTPRVVEPNPLLLDYQGAAKLLGLNVRTLYSMVTRRQVPHLRVSKRLVRFHVETLQQWLRARSVPVKDETKPLEDT